MQCRKTCTNYSSQFTLSSIWSIYYGVYIKVYVKVYLCPYRVCPINLLCIVANFELCPYLCVVPWLRSSGVETGARATSDRQRRHGSSGVAKDLRRARDTSAAGRSTSKRGAREQPPVDLSVLRVEHVEHLMQPLLKHMSHAEYVRFMRTIKGKSIAQYCTCKCIMCIVLIVECLIIPRFVHCFKTSIARIWPPSRLH